MIFIIEGPPRNFKTLFATTVALEDMYNKGVEHVFTSWPVYNKKLNQFTKQWRREYVFENIYDSTIIIDEAYMWYPSRGSGGRYVKYSTFEEPLIDPETGLQAYDDETGRGLTRTKYVFRPGMTIEEHLMFATNGQNGNDFYFIAQSIQRLDTIVHELYNGVYHCKRKDWPVISKLADRFGIDLPMKADIKGFEDERYIVENQYYEQNDMYNLPFSKLRRIFKSYNTHFFRKRGIMRMDYPSWTPGDDVKEYVMSQTGGVDQ